MRIPLYLMTSPATHEETVEFLRANENFGLPVEDVTVFTQGTMPAVDATTGRLLLADRGQLVSVPTVTAARCFALEPSLADMPPPWAAPIVLLPDRQPDGRDVRSRVPRLSLARSQSELSTQVVAKRTSRDKVGNVVSIDGKLRIIEYSDLNPLDDAIVGRQSSDGSPIFWAGNTAIHVFDVEFLERMVAQRLGVAVSCGQEGRRYVDASGKRIEPTEPNAIKFERFIFDLLPEARHAIVVEVDEARTFAPVKNAPAKPRHARERAGADDRSALRVAASGGLRASARRCRRIQPFVCPKCRGSGCSRAARNGRDSAAILLLA